jgi:hypothetical protein
MAVAMARDAGNFMVMGGDLETVNRKPKKVMRHTKTRTGSALA